MVMEYEEENTHMLEVKNITKKFGTYTAVDHLSLTVEPGEIYGLLGANGAGKTTTMRMVLGLILPDQGEILFKGRGLDQSSNHLIGYLPEERGLYPKVKVKDQMIYLAQLRGMSVQDADRSLKRWLDRFEVPEYYNMKIEELSKGNQQKMGFIAAVIHHPKILVMDEVFSGLDPVNVEKLKAAVLELRDEGTCILFSTHRMGHVEELCENITILRRSKPVLQGNLQQIKDASPMEVIVMRTAGAVAGLEHIAGVSKVEQTKMGYLLRLAAPDNAMAQRIANQVLAAAVSQTNVLHFELKEPTMNEIFIKVVGGEEHE
jgi:ABC-2 type transport system ATP-binding protein